MKIISNKEVAANTIELEIEIDAEELEKGIQASYEKEGKDIAIPGFRKGKATRKVIEQRFGKGVFIEDAVNSIYPSAYSDAVKEANLEPVAPGDIEILKVEQGVGFTFKAIITVKPVVTITDYKGLAADKVISPVLEADVDAEVERMRQRGARLVEVTDRAAQDGDSSNIDFEGFVADVAFDGGKGENHDLVLGSNSFIPGFEEQIIGKNVGEEFDVNVTFPQEYHSEDLAGKEAVFKVKLNSLKFEELPELDDEFAKDVSEFDTLEEVKEDIRKNLGESGEKSAEDALENALVDKVIEKLEGEIPDVMYESRIDEMVDEFAHRLSHQGMELDLYLQYTGMGIEDFRKSFGEQAKRQVKIRLALEKIVELENITPTEDELNEEYKRLAEMYKMEEAEIKAAIPSEHVAADLSSSKAIDLIRETAIVTNKKPEDVIVEDGEKVEIEIKEEAEDKEEIIEE